MAITRPTFTFSLLIATAVCLMAIKAEEQPTALEAEDRQAKQTSLMPQYYPADTQFYYPDSSRYGNFYPSPYDVPATEPFVGDIQDTGFPYGYPMLAFGDDGTADWRHVRTGVNDAQRVKSWKRNSNRQATINIFPTATECLFINIATDGLGPCKEATQVERGVIDIRFTAAGQTAIIGITADSQRHTRVTLICTEIVGAHVFTQSGKINAITDTPRTEIGYIQLVATSTAIAPPPPGSVKCNWISFHHYTATYP